ncbi:MAG: NupC/NupG family nucleoside CNT transporter [Ignavibacteria bacterium]|nr:NupC/NupG family nucleoside CNT transporter [Ignavibacteria bacterium]MBK7412284.1 NupC/NupG family nucleoside CNT transporter [Ignavibacteria bacterium]
MAQIQCAIGIVVILGLTWLWSSNKRGISWRTILWGLALQLILALIVVVFPPGVRAFQWFGDGVTWFLSFATQGAAFLFGNLALPAGQAVVGFQFAITITSVIVFFSSCMAVLYHYGIMQRFVRWTARILERTMKTSPIESINAVGEIFLGQTESPLLVKRYIPYISSSELFAMMVGGFATIAGSTMGVYVARGINATDLMIASILAAPAALALAKIAEPHVRSSKSVMSSEVETPEVETHTAGNLLDAIAHGAFDGAKLALNVIVVLIAFKAIVAFLDALLGMGSAQLSTIGLAHVPTSIEQILGYVFLPFAWLTGIPSSEAQTFASLLGTKIAMTEFIAYDNLATLVSQGALSERTVRLATIALCGFANVMSIGIQIGGYGMMAPNRRAEVARFGFKAMCIGALANLFTACVAGLFI